ncbi:hypothetical protein NDU88_002228 [Pleurodeles waltl]|uniref:Uncharacterized protein n=1 Tax=Pleurodeles waltl TaxID=8319 RepID=A0AAV7T1C9_PLEWA|nr:hypothetical protein NDU88_002228 [Pleurodeles waltl]
MMRCTGRCLRLCWVDLLWFRETRLRPQQGLHCRVVLQSSRLFIYAPPLQGLGLGMFVEPPELVVSCLRRPQGSRNLPESVAATCSEKRVDRYWNSPQRAAEITAHVEENEVRSNGSKRRVPRTEEMECGYKPTLKEEIT